MSEFTKQIIENPFVRAGVAVVTAAGMLSLAGCGEESHEVTVVPNIGPVLTDKAHCSSDPTFPRPCVALIRTKPKQKADFLNADASQTTPVQWPHEAYGGKAGQKVTVVCQVRGEQIKDATGKMTGNHVSTIWDVVAVPYERLAESRKKPDHATGFKYGYASDLLLGNYGVYSALDACTPEQNPADAPPVQ